MKRWIILMMMLPVLLGAHTLKLKLAFDEDNPSGFVTAPGRLSVPVFTVNVLLPAGAEIQSYELDFSKARPSRQVYDRINPPWMSSDAILDAAPATRESGLWQYQGQKRWGDLVYASFQVLPYVAQSGLWHSEAELSLSYSSAKHSRNYIPPSFRLPGFFINQSRMTDWYQRQAMRNYDCLVVGKPQHTSALGAWQTFRQSQGLSIQYADIDQILATQAGDNPADKLRNYLIAEYNQSPFIYLLLVGDYDSVPVAYLTPEPMGSETVPSDFFYSDLSSIWDTNGNGLYGEYSQNPGEGDWAIDFTPEVFVGRISTNEPSEISTIASRIVSYETEGDPYRNKALLPAAYLNYDNEPIPLIPLTDGADLMELSKNTALRNYQCTTMYEQEGVLPSYASDYPLDFDGFNHLLRNQDYGIISWSAHGSSSLSARKIWMNDNNGNNQADPYEMQWKYLVDKSSFDGIISPGGTVVFAASCYNGQIDSQESSLAEYALIKKAVGVIAATRTGWYKPGWCNPGWGGLSSYNYHFLENYAEAGLSLGAAHAYTNLLHTNYYLFGDPLDSDGIIWPELQNVYTYLLYGDPAVGHGNVTYPDGEILVWFPHENPDYRLINTIREITDYNVVYSNRIIPDYDYLNGFKAIFCSLDGHQLEAWEEQALNDYLDNGGKIYLEGELSWNANSIFLNKFGVIASPANSIILWITSGDKTWNYLTNNIYYQMFSPIPGISNDVFTAHDGQGNEFCCGVSRIGQSYRTVATGFYLSEIRGASPSQDANTFEELLALILDELDVNHHYTATPQDLIPSALPNLKAWPNPARGQMSFMLENPGKAAQTIYIYNLRGQRIKSLQLDAKNGFVGLWDGRDALGKPCPAGIYIIRSAGLKKKVTLVR